MHSPSKPVPDWLMERLAAGDLPEAQARTLQDRMASSGGAQLAALATSNPAEQVVAEVRRRAAPKAPKVRPWAWPGFAWGALRGGRRRALAGPLVLAMGAVAVVLVLVRTPTNRTSLSTEAQKEETITLKGLQPSLGLYRKVASGVERLGQNSRLRPGDIVQMRYIAAGQRYGVVVSADARKAVTLHLPEKPGRAVALEKDGERALAHAFELDDSPGFERFVFVTANVPFDTDLIVRSLRQGLPLPQGFTLWSMTLHKEKP
jgi:hypothetical protein